MSPVKANAEALKAEQTKADESNKAKTGIGLRTRVGQTRGKNPSVISWDAFDESAKDTLPKTIKDFMAVVGLEGPGAEPTMVEYLIDGFNASAYAQASDEIGEFINDSWDKEMQAQFRLAVRNFSKSASMSIEDAVNIIKPALDKAYEAKVALAKANDEAAKA